MMARLAIGLCTVGLCLLVLADLSSSEIHRAKVLSKSKHQSARLKHKQAAPKHTHAGEQEMPADSGWTFLGHPQETWVFALISAGLVGLTGIFPLFVIPLEAGKALQTGTSHDKLNMLLSFAVGGLLGDVFLHLLPEAWAHVHDHDHEAHTRIGLWIITGMLTFLIIEKVFPESHADPDSSETIQAEPERQIRAGQNTELKESQLDANTKLRRSPRNKSNGSCEKVGNKISSHNGHSPVNGHANGKTPTERSTPPAASDERGDHIKTSGWLNLLANFIDNFTHGLAVAGSYCVDTKTGVITTIAILLHEIPHEIGDFAILLRAGFDRWRAAKAQLITAFGGLLGAVVALSAESAEKAGDSTAWILPFTSGGFIYIALVTVVPDLMKEENPWKSFKQVLLLCVGIAVMAGVTMLS